MSRRLSRNSSGRGQGFEARSAAGLASLGLIFLAGGCVPDRGTIGAVLAQTTDQRLVLREVPPDLAAGRAGLAPGDEILLIDGRDVRELDERGVHRTLSGSAGDPVKLTLLREGRILRVTLRRTPPPKKG
jgi:C-terminal processing protease CtpA/Prc